MNPDFDSIRKQALDLSGIERARLMNDLLETLMTDEQRAREQRWAEEAERRLADFDSGKDESVPWSDLRDRLSQ